MNYENESTRWWLLQVQLPARHGKQQSLLSKPIPRSDLLREAIKIIPENIKISHGSASWGFANLGEATSSLFSFYLTIRPPKARIAEEPEPGHLQDTKDPRFYTLCIINIPNQIIMVHKGSDVSRFAKSARTFADIFQELLKNAVSALQMQDHYIVEVDPIAQAGSFVEWVRSQDTLQKIIIKHTGSNLPSGASNLIREIRESAKQYQKALNSKDVELVANEPELNDEEIEELDKAAADRRLKLRAKGIKLGVGTTWSSSKKPIPETATMSISEDLLLEEKYVAERINIYINERFEER